MANTTVAQVERLLDSLNGEGGQSQELAVTYHPSGFTSENIQAGNHTGVPYGLPSLEQFMPEHIRPYTIEFKQPLLLQSPAPLEIDANQCPSDAVIVRTVDAPDNGATNDGLQSPLLAV